jgi:hypothetical protein
MRPRLALLLVMGLAAAAVLIAVTPPGEAATATVRNALFAKNAGAVNGIRASRTPRPRRLVALDRRGQGPNIWTGVTLPIPAPTPVDSRHVVIAGNDVVDGSGCTGTVADPVSAPGYVCVHPVTAVNTDTGFEWGAACSCGDPVATGDGSRFGFLVQVGGAAGALLTTWGTWVYTAA